MKLLLPMALLLLYAAGPQCEVRGANDGGTDGSTRRDGGRPGGDGGVPGDDDWDPNLPDGGFPGSGKNGDPGTDVMFLVRVDRGLANDAALYQPLVDQVSGSLRLSGLRVLRVVVASLQDGQLLWGRYKDAPPPVKLVDVLTYYAQQSADPSAPCSTTGLAQLGAGIPYAPLIYPPELTGVTWYEQPFFTRPGALLVVLIDHDVRPQPPSSIDCQVGGLSPADWFGGGNSPPWQAGWSLHRPRTRFWAIFTPEGGLDPATMRANCLASGFPASALDVISSSPVSFYEPWTAEMNLRFPNLVSRADFCSSMVGNLPAKDWADEWAKVLRAEVGLP